LLLQKKIKFTYDAEILTCGCGPTLFGIAKLLPCPMPVKIYPPFRCLTNKMYERSNLISTPCLTYYLLLNWSKPDNEEVFSYLHVEKETYFPSAMEHEC